MNNLGRSLNSATKILNFSKDDFQNKILDNLAIKGDAGKGKNDNAYEKFSPHPERLFLDSNPSSISLENDYRENRRSLDYDTILEMKKMMSETSSCATLDRSPMVSLCSEIKRDFRSGQNDRNEKERLEIELSNNWKDQDIPKMVASNQQKFANILQKILSCLNDVRNTVDTEVDPPDGVEDWERIRKRTAEFSSRFSRNYLYPLERQTNMLQKMTRCTKNIAHQTIINIQIQLLTTYQNVFCALHVFRGHVMACIVNSLLDKLKHLLEQISILCKIHAKCINIVDTDISQYESLVDTLQKACSIFLASIEKETKESHPNSTTKPSLNLIPQCKEGKFRDCHKNNTLEARLSMYSTKQTKGIWRRSVEAVAREKLKFCNVVSRYKTAGYKNNFKVDISVKPEVKPVKIKKCIYKTPIVTARNEDEIQTMVEFHKENVTNPHLDMESIAKDDVILKTNFCFDKFSEKGLSQNVPVILRELCKNICVSNDDSVTQKQMDTLFRGLSEIAPNENIDKEETGSINDRREILGPSESICEENGDIELRNDESDIAKVSNETNQKVKNKCKTSGIEWKNKNRQIISVTGVKNAQLICMKSDYSTPSLKRLNITRIKAIENEKFAKSKTTRTSKSILKQLTVIPKPEAFNVINYKLRYNQYVAGNTLYVKSKVHRPWIIVDNIAERLLRDLLYSICKEILMDEALKDMFISEFR